MKHFSSFLIVALAALAFSACTSSPHDVTVSRQRPAIYPDYTEVTIPVGIAPLNFAMADRQTSTVDVWVRGSRGGQLHVNGSDADFDVDDWHELTQQNRGGHLTVTVSAERNGQWTQYADFRIYVSRQSLDEWGLTYRLIPPSYAMFSQMGLYQRDLSNFDETPLIVNTQTPNQCVNCHTPNHTNPDQYVFHVRGNHGATVIHSQGNDEILAAKSDHLGGSMVYPYWHPKGRYCAFSTNKTSQLFHTAKKNKRIEVYDNASNVFIYDVAKHTILRDTLLMTRDWMENTPAFSPDGRWLYFTTALHQSMPDDYDKVRYSLCRVAFDDATGQLGDRVDTLINARLTGKSVTWPRPSYDGRYVMYTQMDYGYFSVWHPESDLWLLDVATGERRPMREVNSPRAESLHAWSSNSRWFLFTSRRDDGLYSRIYLASVDEKGRVSKPFMLPQRHPADYYQQSLYSYNTPDFTARRIDSHAASLASGIESERRIVPDARP